jgi:hypothetical protein
MSGAPYGVVGQDIVADSKMGWTRLYYVPGSAMNYGAASLNIPYQFDTNAVGASPDIKVVVMDGGGNDVLIDNRGCLTTVDSTCTSAIDMSIARAGTLMKDMASKGVQHIVYFYYPHLDPAGGGLLPVPAPTVNQALDYALPKAEAACCGSSFSSSTTDYSCRGNAPGIDCVMIDTIPAFTGHLTDYIQADHVHPTASGSQVIADLVWNTMVKYCIAQ